MLTILLASFRGLWHSLRLQTDANRGMGTLSLLLSLMHGTASLDSRVKGLEVVKKILRNIIDHPAEDKYRSVNLTSSTWANCITPAFHAFQLIEWLLGLGFEQSAEGSFLLFKTHSLESVTGAYRDVCFFLCICDSGAASDADVGKALVTEFVELLRVVVGQPSQRPQINMDSISAHGVILESALSTSAWEVVKNYLRFTVVERECKKHGRSCSRVDIHHPTIPAQNLDVWASLCNVVRFLSLRQLEEGFVILDTEMFDRLESVSFCSAGKGSENRSAARKAVSLKHKRMLGSQSGSCVALNSEVQTVGTQLIVDIASCIEQIAVIKGDQKMVREDRFEARRLLEKFGEDGDVEYLHRQKEEWVGRLEEVKKKLGKSLVYFQ